MPANLDILEFHSGAETMAFIIISIKDNKFQ